MRYRIDNWSEYNRALVKRGRVTFWIEDGALEKWFSTDVNPRGGRPQTYSDDAILMLLVLREVYSLPLRALEGFASSIFMMLGLYLPVPSYTQISRRAGKLQKKLNRLGAHKGVVNLIFDSTGLKLYGEGEWKVRTHGKDKRRSWRKLHLGISADTQEILFCELTDNRTGDAQVAEECIKNSESYLGRVYGDGAYDSGKFRGVVLAKGGEVVIPPKRGATYKGIKEGWQRERDKDIAEIEGLGGDDIARGLWKKLTGYHIRSLVETAMYRLKQIIGDKLKSRSSKGQATEVYCKSLILNKMTELGLPKGRWVMN